MNTRSVGESLGDRPDSLRTALLKKKWWRDGDGGGGCGRELRLPWTAVYVVYHTRCITSEVSFTWGSFQAWFLLLLFLFPLSGTLIMPMLLHVKMCRISLRLCQFSSILVFLFFGLYNLYSSNSSLLILYLPSSNLLLSTSSKLFLAVTALFNVRIAI